MNKYEGLFILEASAKDDALQKTINKIEEAIKGTGGKVLEVEKLDQRPFARPRGNQQGGYYVNLSFDAPSTAVRELDARFHLESDVIRWQFTTRASARKDDKKRKRKPTQNATATAAAAG